MESSSVTVLRRRNEDCAKNTRSHGSTLRKDRVTIEVCLVPDGTDSRRVRFGRKEEIKGREGFPYDKSEGSDDPRGSSNSICESERRSLFHSIHDRTDLSTSIEHLCQDAEGGRCASESLTLASTAGYASKQTDEGEHEITRGVRAHEKDRRNQEILKQGAEAH